MPWHIEKRKGQSKPYCVVKSTDNKTITCHKTMKKAKAHITALRINVKD